MQTNGNFSYLHNDFPLLAELAETAERHVYSDPGITLYKLRQFLEAMTQQMIFLSSISSRYIATSKTSADLFDRINFLGRVLKINESVLNLFHLLRRASNSTIHINEKDVKKQKIDVSTDEGLDALRVAWYLGRWFYASFAKNKTAELSKQFIVPEKSAGLSSELNAALGEKDALIAELQAQLNEQNTKYLNIVKEHEQKLAELEKSNEKLKSENERLSFDTKRLQQISKSIHEANRESTAFDKDEQLTRIIIDAKLQEAGWISTAKCPHYSEGVRPSKGSNIAIAEYPTASGPADYALFCGLMPVAIIEAKKGSANIPDAISQAERYARDFVLGDLINPNTTNENWHDAFGSYVVPFVFATNGKSYYEQNKEHSGLWIRDVRKAGNIRTPIGAIPKPESLLDRLSRDKERAAALIKKESFSYFNLRPYQIDAVKTIEHHIIAGRQRMLVSMATGTGKTRMALALIYRLLKSEYARRILFVVDRNLLAKQTYNSFSSTLLDNNKPITSNYNVNAKEDLTVESYTRLQICTIQSLVNRTILSDNPLDADAFDIIIVDEAHRGYTPDAKATSNEQLFLSEQNYLNTYKRVLDYFPATVIGLTATPSSQSVALFGEPIFNYDFKQAVIDGYLAEREPTITYKTELSTKGISFSKDSTAKKLHSDSNIIYYEVPDEDLFFDVTKFNTQVESYSFNETVLREFINDSRIDIFSERKTLIFCARDYHADMVKHILDKLFKEKYGDKYDEKLVKKITGKADDPQMLTDRFRLEKEPNIAITVELLTTGIDVPKICNLLFLRFLRSPVLFEQMLGRATRLCPAIGKYSFNVFDAVGVVEYMDNLDPTMKSFKYQNTDLSLNDIINILTDDTKRQEAKTKPSDIDLNGKVSTNYAKDLVLIFSRRVGNLIARAKAKEKENPKIKDTLQALKSIFKCENESDITETLRNLDPDNFAFTLKIHEIILPLIKDLKNLSVERQDMYISDKEDKIVAIDEAKNNSDKLSKFKQIVEDNADCEIIKKARTSPYLLTKDDEKRLKTLFIKEQITERALCNELYKKNILQSEDKPRNFVDLILIVCDGITLLTPEVRAQEALGKTIEKFMLNDRQGKKLKQIATLIKHEIFYDESIINSALRDMGGIKNARLVIGENFDKIIAFFLQLFWQRYPKD